MKTLDEQIQKNKNVRFARMQRFRKTHREHIDGLPKAMRHDLIRKLKTPVVMVAIFFLARTGFCQGDTSAWLPQYIASVVESERALDSMQSTPLTLVPFQKEITKVARKYNIPPALLTAFVQKESAFSKWAGRVELHYKKKQVVIREAKAWSKKKKGIPTFNTELDDRSRSYGLGQIMGQSAREQGYDSTFLATLYEPEINLTEVCKKIRSLFDRYGTDTLSVISAYNQGNNRKKGGVVENIGYCYDVIKYWEKYDWIFTKKAQYEYQKNFNRVRDSILVRFNPWQFTIMYGLWGRTDSFGIAQPGGITNSDTTQRQREGEHRDSAALLFPQSKAESRNAVFFSEYTPRYIKEQSTNILMVATGLVGMFGLGWFFLNRYRLNADLSRYNQRVPRLLDWRTKRRLRKELKATREGRALHRVGHFLANSRSNTHGAA